LSYVAKIQHWEYSLRPYMRRGVGRRLNLLESLAGGDHRRHGGGGLRRCGGINTAGQDLANRERKEDWINASYNPILMKKNSHVKTKSRTAIKKSIRAGGRERGAEKEGRGIISKK